MKTKKINQEKNDEMREIENRLARALADYDNLKKRTEVEKKMWLKFAKGELVIKFLPIFDTLEMAQKHLNDAGLGMVINQIKDVLAEEGVHEIDTKGDFDESMHEAVELVPGGAHGAIAETVQRGYKFSEGDVIRPAKVKVYEGQKEK